MGILIKNGILITLGEKNRVIENGAVLIEGNKIKDFGTSDEFKKPTNAEEIDASGKIIMPGFICTHHHLYSTFSRGMRTPKKPARNFLEILEKIWWRLDRTLTAEDIYYSSLIPLIESIKKGTTTIFDHHESQSYQVGSLNEIQKAVREMGIRACLCLGTSDRYGKGKDGLEENARFLKKIKNEKDKGLATGMVGLHASFTVSDETLDRSVEIAQKYNCGIHLHVAEDKSDEDDSLRKYALRIVERLEKHGALGQKSIAVHCVNIDERERDILRETKTNVVHNPESNMNNAVGCADVPGMMRKGILIGLGTDGMSSDMLSQMRAACLILRHTARDLKVGFSEAAKMLLENNPEIGERVNGFKIGRIERNYLADIILLDYFPPTEINEDNFLGHLAFGMVNSVVDTTICNGKILMRNKKLIGIDEERITQKSRELARKLWERLDY
ncbi:hypothetical protein CH333_01555 [candidate division WOR-3 bacterium JGI_Cruoil_03_44_89]|uniref:Amidohydrolase-related domain-containing protein n=1 Tax=candidate division WOR-3 bacterium JGI_Cruoil_03_44_89 TaxID=1973748 RepID=A0A235BYG0_UNCW3|nr:MAG: hypothetical protein CH333_01555 [candidate division WOR-3 bacterium JGI_Cruoil_03_44_89]